MDLKFTFGGASPDQHDHGGAPSGVPLPFSAAPPVSTSSVLEVRVSRSGDGLRAAAVTGDGVVYCEAEAPLRGEGSAELARAVRSAASRAVAALEGPLTEAVTALVVDLGGGEAAVLDELGVSRAAEADPSSSGAAALRIGETLQRRIGIAAGTAVRIGA